MLFFAFEDAARVGVDNEIEIPLPVPNLDISQASAGTKGKMPLSPLNIRFDRSGRLSIAEHIGSGWRRAHALTGENVGLRAWTEKQWRFSKCDEFQRHGQTGLVRLSLFPIAVNQGFNPSNAHPSVCDARCSRPETKFPGDSEPPQFAQYSGIRDGVAYRVQGSDCHVSLDLFDDRGDFNQDWCWEEVDEKPTFTSTCDLWAQPFRFATPPTFEDVAPTLRIKGSPKAITGAELWTELAKWMHRSATLDAAFERSRVEFVRRSEAESEAVKEYKSSIAAKIE